MLAIGRAFLQATLMVVYRIFYPSRLFYFKGECMNIYLEIFGYIGTALVIISMTMKSLNKLRVVNICGAVISAIYSALISAWPIVLLNVTLATINSYHVIRTYIYRKNQKAKSDNEERKDI